jgi:hypothetical protein
MELNDLADVLKTEPVILDQENILLKPLLSELKMIENSGIRSFTRAILLRAGPFWHMPAFPQEGIYPPDEYDSDGAVLHTKRVVRATLLLSAGFRLTPLERDMALSAALLHGVTKGKYDDDYDSVMFDIMYPYTVKLLVDLILTDDEVNATESQSNTLDVEPEIVEQILKLIRGQAGSRSIVPESAPKPYSYNNILHLATIIAMNVHLLIDGDNVIQERWKVGPTKHDIQEASMVDTKL